MVNEKERLELENNPKVQLEKGQKSLSHVRLFMLRTIIKILKDGCYFLGENNICHHMIIDSLTVNSSNKEHRVFMVVMGHGGTINLTTLWMDEYASKWFTSREYALKQKEFRKSRKHNGKH